MTRNKYDGPLEGWSDVGSALNVRSISSALARVLMMKTYLVLKSTPVIFYPVVGHDDRGQVEGPEPLMQRG